MAWSTEPEPAGEPRWIGFELVPGLDEPAGLTVPDRHHKVWINENEDLAELDDLHRVGVTGRLRHDEECLVEGLQLGSSGVPAMRRRLPTREGRRS